MVLDEIGLRRSEPTIVQGLEHLERIGIARDAEQNCRSLELDKRHPAV